MKKFLRKLFGYVLCLTTAAGMFTACGKPKFGDSNQNLEVWVSVTGYGRKWLDDALEKFSKQGWVKEKYPEFSYKVVENTTDGNYGFETTVAGAKVNSYDLIAAVAAGGSYFSSNQFEDLDELYNTRIPGETLTIKEKMLDDIYYTQGYEQLDDTVKYYSVPWNVGTMGLFYNESVIESVFGNDYTTPKTSDELVKFCQDIKKAGEVPIVSSVTSNYWSEIFKLWWAQYEGIENYKNFWLGVNEDGDYDGEVMGQLGRKYSLQVIDSLINSSNGLIHEDCTDTVKGYKTMQTYLLVGEGAIMPNGDWLANEMEGEDSSDIRMMKTPVISNIVERCPSIKNGITGTADERLSKVVGYVDEGKPYGEAKTLFAEFGTLTESDYKIIDEARNSIAIYGGLAYHIPKYATAKEVAKDFILYCATDEGIKTIMDAGKGFLSPYKYDVTDMSGYNNLSKDALTYAKTGKFIPPHTMFRLYCYGGLIPLRATVNQIDSVFMAENAKDRSDPVTMYESDYNYYKADNYKNWNIILKKAGII